MLTHFYSYDDDSKSLYFKLNNALHLAEPFLSPTFKMSGIYALYKNDRCYYVGQSQNIPSRLSTHLKGRYENIDKIYVWFTDEYRFSDFYKRSKESKKAILENNESYLISKLKPIENILVKDYAEKEEELFSIFTDNDITSESGYIQSDCEILIKDKSSFLISNELYVTLLDIKKHMEAFNYEI